MKISVHPDNPDYHDDIKMWEKSISTFSEENDFLNLSIEDVQEGSVEAFVTFKAHISNGFLHERSRFVKKNGRWLYIDSDIKEN